MFRKEVIKLMVEMYQTYDYCWMGYPITEDNYITYHHINEYRKSKPKFSTIENGALLSKDAHNHLNSLEHFYPELYHEFNYFFKIINEMKCPVTPEMRAIMQSLVTRMNEALATKKKSRRKQRYIK